MLHAFGKLEVGYSEDKIIKLNNQLSQNRKEY